MGFVIKMKLRFCIQKYTHYGSWEFSGAGNKGNNSGSEIPFSLLLDVLIGLVFSTLRSVRDHYYTCFSSQL